MKILIGVDDSSESRQAVEVADRLFGEDDYTIISVGSRTPLLAAGYTAGSYATAGDIQAQFDAAQRVAETATAEAASALPAGRVIQHVDMGRIGEALCRAAVEQQSDVIVIGLQYKNVWRRLFDPSVGRYLVDNAPCPVLVVR